MKHQRKNLSRYSRHVRAFLFSVRHVVVFLPAIAMVLCAGCGADTPSEAELQALSPYMGEWEGEDGTTIAVRRDGTGSFETGTTSVTGGTARVDEQAKRLTISGLLGIKGEWQIEEPPHMVAGREQMKLGGMFYRRVGGFNGSASGESGGTVPSDSAVHAMVTTTLLDLNTAIVSGNFEPFYATIAPTWQAQTTPDTFRDAFKELAEQKIDFRAIANYMPVFQPPPALDENGMLVASGHYSISDNRLDFTVKYLWEQSQWRPFATQVNLRKVDTTAAR